jgi:hypothetical protein
MQRAAVLVLFMVAFLWQSVGMARVGPTIDLLGNIEHAALHENDEGHHHHDDGSLHVDDSAESMQHVIADQLHFPAALLCDSRSALPESTGGSPVAMRDRAVADPFLAGLLRPPRLHS